MARIFPPIADICAIADFVYDYGFLETLLFLCGNCKIICMISGGLEDSQRILREFEELWIIWPMAYLGHWNFCAVVQKSCSNKNTCAKMQTYRITREIKDFQWFVKVFDSKGWVLDKVGENVEGGLISWPSDNPIFLC